ncbi:MAG: HAD-IC family P-type ATPase, partial [Deltaproteobacteria bacterium]|nr:HAD-IC family P-type ATPase [Deltaproteobacteria bacterium]
MPSAETTPGPSPTSNSHQEALGPHTRTVTDVAAALETDPVHGLAQTEAALRLARVGANELQAARMVSPWVVFASQFKNVLILILLVAVGLSAFLGHGVEAVTITIIVLFAVLLGFIQEFRAERAIEALRRMAAPVATVLREGEEIEIPAREVVPGDIALLHVGDRVCADARLMEAVNLQIDEAVLTGESFPVEKHTKPLENGAMPVGDRKNMAYSGTAVTYGRGRALVVATGTETEFGKIATLLQSVKTAKTPLQENLDRVGHVLARVAVAIVALIISLGLFRGEPFVEMLIFGIALAVAVVPEALPAVVTISLALGVQRMVKRNALVRRLPSVETLGSTSVICSDKTGTLTRDEMTTRRVFAAGKVFEVSGTGYEPVGAFSLNDRQLEPPETLKQLLRGAALASDARLVLVNEQWTLKGDPTEGALVVAAAKAGLNKVDLDSQFPRIHEIPFTSETKRMTTLHECSEGTVA